MHTRSAVSLKSAIALALFGGIATQVNAAPTAGSAYYTDPQSSYVEDATSKGIGQVNMIACIMGALKADVLVNQGPYIALVDENKCDPNARSNTSNSSGSDGAQAASYTTTVVNSTRTSNTDPMITKVWLDEDQDGQSATIFVHVSATEAPSDNNPYGQFRLDFCGKGQGMQSCMMQGYLQGSSGALSYYQHEQRDFGSSTVALRLTSVGTTTGSGKMSMDESDGNLSSSQEFLFAYDQAHFLRGDQCFSRDASDPETGMSVWRYGLYDATSGARITRNSGFPIEYASGGVTYHGYLGYWGLSLPSAAALTNGATVQKVDYSSGNSPTRTDYTVTMAGGKLTKYTKHTRSLQSLDKIRLNTWIGDVTGFYNGAQPNTQYELYWDEANQHFVASGIMNCGNNGCQTQTFGTGNEQPISNSYWQNHGGGVQGWSQTLGGDVYVDLHANPLVTNAEIVVYHSQDLVYPSAMPSQLYCVNNCPTADSLSTFFTQNGVQSPFAAGTFNNWQPNTTPIVYGADTGNAVLTSNNQAVVYTDASAYQSHPEYQWGVRSGRLFTTLSDAQCGVDQNSNPQYCDYKVNDANEYYVWETGPNNWNQFAAVKDSNGAFLQFDAPLQLNYQVPNDAQYGDYAGKVIVLQYGGFGDLWGIPGHCVSHLTNLPVSCDTQDSRYVPEFVIPYDATGVVSDGSTQYYVKWLDREIRFARKDLSACSSLTLPANVDLPTQSDLKDPSDSSSDIYIGAKPSVTSAPRVIQGEVEY